MEKKLGIKGRKSKALEEEGLDWLVGGSESDGDKEKGGSKRKRSEDTRWLQDKRQKAAGVDGLESEQDDELFNSHIAEAEESDAEDDDLENPFSDDEFDSDDFPGFDAEDEEDEDGDELPSPKKERENPYVAPVPNDAAPVAKYVPPSMRKPAAADEEALRQLRRQVQGLLNRLSEANMPSIVKSLQELYEKNARQHVTSTLVELLAGLMSDPSTLNDTFLILHAGFSAAVYRAVGTDFGAQLLEKVVENFDHHRNVDTTPGKQTLNLLAFLSCLYTFQVVGSSLIFDYIRLLLYELSEANTELLLRVIRTAGQQLRHDDPSSLKDIVMLLQRAVAKTGEDTLSVRTKFMIETINNLKNNRMKAGATGSALAAEHSTRMKKTLGSLKTGSGRTTEPLRITLEDIRDSDKKGKWWLVGASYRDPAKLANNDNIKSTTRAQAEDSDAGYDSETPGNVNLRKLAKSQGMNTDVRRAIFVTLLSAADYKDAHMRLLKLHLRNKQMLEIPRVLVHCVGTEQGYNPYYALAARKFCGDHKLRKAFQFALWDVFRRMEEEDDNEEGGEMSVRKIVNLGKFYGTLVANGGQSIAVLKKLDFAYLQSEVSMFVEVLLTTALVQAHELEAPFEDVIKDVFSHTAGGLDMLKGLSYFLQTHMSGEGLARGKKEKKVLQIGSRLAVEALDGAIRSAPVSQDDNEDDED